MSERIDNSTFIVDNYDMEEAYGRDVQAVNDLEIEYITIPKQILDCMCASEERFKRLVYDVQDAYNKGMEERCFGIEVVNIFNKYGLDLR